jgi:hypothetical protein
MNLLLAGYLSFLHVPYDNMLPVATYVDLHAWYITLWPIYKFVAATLVIVGG